MPMLDLKYNEFGKYYEAPLQMKANGGIFMIDDFGRQQVRATDLLNRWIVPLEKKYDYLNTVNGTKVEVPFDQLLIFSTNLDPHQLADEAFLRRIKFKIDGFAIRMKPSSGKSGNWFVKASGWNSMNGASIT